MEKEAVLGIDAGGTKVCIGLVSEQGKILDSIRYPQRYSSAEIWIEKLLEQIQILLTSTNEVIRIKAAGLGLRGHVDFKTQKLLSTSIMEVMPAFDLCGVLRKRLGVPVYIDNDVKAAAHREIMFGIGRWCKNFACYNIGTGIAVSIILDGCLIRGENNNIGEISEDIFYISGEEKSIEKLEEIASGQGITNEAKRLLKAYPCSSLSKSGENMQTQDVVMACRQKDPLAQFIVNRALDVLAASIVNIKHLLDLEAFVFIGGVVSDSWFWECLQEKVKKLFHAAGNNWLPQLEISDSVRRKSEILGAASLAFHYRKMYKH